MGRTVIGDEAQVEAFLDSLFASGAAVQIGLLIGRLSTGSNRDVVFGLIPTPGKDGEEPCKVVGSSQQQFSKDSGDKRKSARARGNVDSSTLVVDIDWVAEHARQVSRMLLGGMHVVGIYCLGNDVWIKSSLATLWQAVSVVTSTQLLLVDPKLEPLLLQVSSSPRRLLCRSCLLGFNFTSASVKPCDWKLGKLLSTLCSFTCHYTYDIRLPILENKDVGKEQPLRRLLFTEIERDVARLKEAPAIVDGIMVEENTLVQGNASDALHQVQFLLPFNLEENRQGVLAGTVTLHGTVYARSYALLREPLTNALSYLKEDISASLRSRIDLLCDVAEQALENAQLGESHSEKGPITKPFEFHALLKPFSEGSLPCSFALPRRVLVPWSSNVFVSDYMLENETFQDIDSRCSELFGRNEALEPAMLEEPEALGTFASMESIKSQSGERAHDKTAAGKSIDHCSKKASFFELVMAIGSQSRFIQNAFVGALTAVFLGIIIAFFLWRHTGGKR